MSKTKIVATFIQAAILVVWIAFVAILFAVMGKAVIDGVNTFGWAYFAESTLPNISGKSMLGC